MDTNTTSSAETDHPYRKAFAWGGIWLVLLTLGFSVAYGHFAAEGFGRFIGMTMVPAAICGYLAKGSKMSWSFWKVGVIYFAIALLVFLISSYGAMQH